MSSTATRGTDEHGMLIDMLARRGFRVHTRSDGVFEVTENNRYCFRGIAAEVHRWLRSRAAA